jgi:mono/diheme cytochrome c family protein
MRVFFLMMRNSSVVGFAVGILAFSASLLPATPRLAPGASSLVPMSLSLFNQGDSVEGKKVFNTVCSACHTVGQGVRVGPDLAGVTKRRSREWLHSFITNSTQFIATGDKDAKAIFEKFKKFPMPPQALSAAKIDSILAYIESVGGEAKSGGGVDLSPPEGDSKAGAEYFQGTRRLQNGGPSCISCHGMDHPSVIAGGTMAVDLSKAYGRLGGGGIKGILSSPPFPLMKKAYEGHSMAPDEIAALQAFLFEANQQASEAKASMGIDWKYGLYLLFGGLVGLVVLLLLFGALWKDRKPGLVNQKIYDRQLGAADIRD